MTAHTNVRRWTRRAGVLLIAGAACAALAAPVRAQQSASYRIEQSTFNAGGHPHQGAFPQSPGYRITFDALGDGLTPVASVSASYHIAGGFLGGARPPGEVMNLRFDDAVTLRWDPEPSAGTYDLYRGVLGTLPGDYGDCLQSGLAAPQATDPATPGAAGSGWFYLVTAENLIQEEGTRGFTSAGGPRLSVPACP